MVVDVPAHPETASPYLLYGELTAFGAYRATTNRAREATSEVQAEWVELRPGFYVGEWIERHGGGCERCLFSLDREGAGPRPRA